MKTAFYIAQLSQIGNIGAHEIKKIDKHPEKGFESYGLAEMFLEELIRKGDWPFNSWYSYTILKLYSK